MPNEKRGRSRRGAKNRTTSDLLQPGGEKNQKNYMSTGRIPMLAVGSFEPGASASPYQAATSEIVIRPRLTFAVRSRVYLHHKCFEIQLVLDLLSRRFGQNRREEGQVAGGVGHYLTSTIFTAYKSCRVVAAGFPIARGLSGYTACTQAWIVHTLRRV